MTLRRRRVFAAMVPFLVLAATPARADSTYSYVVRLGRDTLSLETVTRSPSQVRGEYIVRTPRSLHRAYSMDLAPDGTVRRFEMASRAMGSPPGVGETRATIEFLGDSALVTTPRGDSTATARVRAGPGAVPSLNGVMGIMDQIAWQARGALADSVVLAMVPLGGPVLRGNVVRTAPDTLLLVVDTPVGRVPPFRLVRDGDRSLVSFSGHGSVFQAEAERISPPDLAAEAEAFADRPIGALSSRDTVRATLGAAQLWLDYGRPWKRGREVFGDVVPWDIVWRTGANAATQFRTTHALRVRGKKLRAGLYSLWTLPSPRGWWLIVNAQSGQWGTQYDRASDVARVKLELKPLAEPVEQLTLSLETRGDEGWLVIAWDHKRASVPIRVER